MWWQSTAKKVSWVPQVYVCVKCWLRATSIPKVRLNFGTGNVNRLRGSHFLYAYGKKHLLFFILGMDPYCRTKK
jgi:hypothetical protein